MVKYVSLSALSKYNEIRGRKKGILKDATEGKIGHIRKWDMRWGVEKKVIWVNNYRQSVKIKRGYGFCGKEQALKFTGNKGEISLKIVRHALIQLDEKTILSVLSKMSENIEDGYRKERMEKCGFCRIYENRGNPISF